MNICIFGDSIAWGAYDPENGGWASMLQNKLLSGDRQQNVYNYSICGEGSQDILERFDAEAGVRRPKLVIFAFGANDSKYFDTPDNPYATQEDFVQNVKDLIKEAGRFTEKIVFVGPTYADETQIPFKENGRYIYYVNERIDTYDDLLEAIAQEEDVYYIRMRDTIAKEDLADDVHPNTEGHKKMFETIYAFLKSNKLLK